MTAKHGDHDFVLDSRELNLTLGNAVFDVLLSIKAQMKGPDVNLKGRNSCRSGLYFTKSKTSGLPVGTASKECSCFQIEIDSPGGRLSALKRGVDIEAVHCKPSLYQSWCTEKELQDLTVS